MNRFLLALLLFPIILIGNPSHVQKMVSDLDVIRAIFSTKYAPIEWKKEFCQWDLNEQIDLAQGEIASEKDLTNKQYQRVVKRFFNSTQDYHVKCLFHSTELAFLPFRVKSAEGKYFIVEIDPFFKSYYTELGLEKGAEILTFSGKPIEAVIQELREEEFGQPNSKTDQALAEQFLTLRLGALGHVVPSGTVTISILNREESDLTKIHLNWFYLPETFQGPFKQDFQSKYSAIAPPSTKKSSGIRRSFLEREMVTPLSRFGHTKLKNSFNPPMTEKAADQVGACLSIGSVQGVLPDLGKVVWKASSKNSFRAYIFEAKNGKRVGYVRIPTYMAGEREAAHFKQLIHKFEKSTSALVIDQMDNGGGSVFYLMGLTTMLSDVPIEMPPHRITITQEELADAFELAELRDIVKTDQEAKELFGCSTIHGYPVDLNLVNGFVSYADSIISEWIAGRTLTNPLPLYGLKEVQPNSKTRYTKPIMILVNALDFSGADFFPAIMQDNQRALIVGTKTAGAGGYVIPFFFPNLFGINYFCYTGSIAVRKDQNPIENIAVTPDVILEVTERDLRSDYVDFVEKIHRELDTLIL